MCIKEHTGTKPEGRAQHKIKLARGISLLCKKVPTKNITKQHKKPHQEEGKTPLIYPQWEGNTNWGQLFNFFLSQSSAMWAEAHSINANDKWVQAFARMGEQNHIRQIVLRQSQRHLPLSLRTHGRQTSFRWQIQFLPLLNEMMG